MAPGPGLPGDQNAAPGPTEHDPDGPPLVEQEDCPFVINGPGLPWPVLEQSVELDVARGGIRVVAAAISAGLLQSAVGVGYAVAREPSGSVSLYRYQGWGSKPDFQDALRSVSELYLRPDGPWQRILTTATVADLASWIEAGQCSFSSEARSVFRGARGGLRVYVSHSIGYSGE